MLCKNTHFSKNVVIVKQMKSFGVCSFRIYHFVFTGDVTVESHPLPDSASLLFLSCVVSKCIIT